MLFLCSAKGHVLKGRQGLFQKLTVDLIWLIVDWYDALVLDCLWFCHCKAVRIPGTEEMAEYRDYRFHLRQSCIGMLLGLPVCAAVGALVALLETILP